MHVALHALSSSWGKAKVLSCHDSLVCMVMFGMVQYRPCTCMLLMLHCSSVIAEDALLCQQHRHMFCQVLAQITYKQHSALQKRYHAVCTQVLPIRLPVYPILECGEASCAACLNKVSVCFTVCCMIHTFICPTHLTQSLDSRNHRPTALIMWMSFFGPATVCVSERE